MPFGLPVWFRKCVIVAEHCGAGDTIGEPVVVRALPDHGQAPALRYTCQIMTAVATLVPFDFRHRTAATPRRVRALLHVPGCASCRKWRQLSADYADSCGNVALYQLDVRRDIALVQKFGLFHLPVLHVFPNRQDHRQFASEARMKQIRSALGAALDARQQGAP